MFGSTFEPGGGGGAIAAMLKAQMYLANVQNIPNVAITKILLDAIQRDSPPMCNLAQNRIDIIKAATYLITGQVYYNAAAIPRALPIIFVNGLQAAQSDAYTGAGGNAAPHVHYLVDLVVGNFVELCTYQNSGAPKALQVAPPVNLCFLQVLEYP